jgi:predicted dehydrogenase
MVFGIIGTGYVAQFYAVAAQEWPECRIASATDLNLIRAARFAQIYNLRHHSTTEEMLADHTIEAVLILTDPRSHYKLALDSLRAGKHVYCEKPVALDMASAMQLVCEAESAGLVIASAPCTVLGAAAETADKLLRSGAIGKPVLAYASLDDGAVYRMRFQDWTRAYGAAWPAEQEFDFGCVIEHAAYPLSMLSRFFGVATEMTAQSLTFVPNKLEGRRCRGADFSLAGIRFDSGTFARVTCSIIAPRDRSMKIVGEEGVIEIANIWDDHSPIYWQKVRSPPADAPHDYLGKRESVPLNGGSAFLHTSDASHRMNFALGLAELVKSVAEGRVCRLGGAFMLHVLEVVLAMDAARSFNGSQYEPKTSYAHSELWP